MMDRMQEIGRIEQYADLKAIYQAIFNRVPSVTLRDGSVFTVRSMVGGKIRGVKIRGVNYIEQNPAKSSAPAQRARQGHKIIWVIKDTPGSSQGTYIGRLEDGVVFMDMEAMKRTGLRWAASG